MKHITFERILIAILAMGLIVWAIGVVRFGYSNNIYGQTYFQQFLALLPFVGFLISLVRYRKWGGWSSQLGRAILCYGLGLLVWSAAMIAWTYFSLELNLDAQPFPSIADALFILGTFLWVIGSFILSFVIGVNFLFKQRRSLIEFVLMPISMSLLFSVLMYVIAYQGDMGYATDPLKGITHMLYVVATTLAAVVVLFSYMHAHEIMGGILKKSYMYLFIGHILYYLADFIFTYLDKRNIYVDGGVSDVLYLLSVFCFSYAITKLKIDISPSPVPPSI